MNKIILLLVAITIVYNTRSFAQRITTVVGTGGAAGYSGFGGPATAASIALPDGIAIDKYGQIYMSLGTRGEVLKVDIAGIITQFAGTPLSLGFSGDGGPATTAQLHGPTGITFDSKGNVYIADLGNKRIRKVDTFGVITTFAGNGDATISGDGGAATAAGLGGCQGVCVDSVDNIFMSGAGRIRKVDTFGIITTVAGTGSGGFSGDGGQATDAQIQGNGQVAIDRAGNLYLADVGNLRIRKISVSGIITTIAGTGSIGFSGDGGLATAAKIWSSGGVFPDSAGNVFIADHRNNRIRMINSADTITTVVGTGYGADMSSGGFSGDGGHATAARLYRPAMMYYHNHNLYFADKFNYCIRKVDLRDTVPHVVDTPETVVKVIVPTPTLLITPSPTSGTFTISLPATPTGQVQVTVTDITGRVVATRAATAGKAIPINLAAVPGMYLVTAEANGVRYVGRVQVE